MLTLQSFSTPRPPGQRASPRAQWPKRPPDSQALHDPDHDLASSGSAAECHEVRSGARGRRHPWGTNQPAQGGIHGQPVSRRIGFAMHRYVASLGEGTLAAPVAGWERVWPGPCFRRVLSDRTMRRSRSTRSQEASRLREGGSEPPRLHRSIVYVSTIARVVAVKDLPSGSPSTRRRSPAPPDGAGSRRTSRRLKRTGTASR